jgi:TatD DNase family protein|tara:strand:- start:30216 stop:31061 length:846 start_codon:yes stop_codon:yes gene_type:complete
MSPKFVDIHSHVNFSAFDEDRDEVITRSQDSGVWMINVGTQRDTSQSAVELSEKHSGVFATVGLHPIHTDKSFHDKKELGGHGEEFTARGEIFDFDYYETLAEKKSVVAIGECGLDYYRLGEDSKKKQKETFEKQITLANEVNKPLMLHIRPAIRSLGAGGNAYSDAYEIVKSTAKVGGNVHFFAGTWEEAKLFLDIGFTLSFTGVITFAETYNETIMNAPLDMIMSETDAPYVAPVPYRGKRNEPRYVTEVVKKISDIRGEEYEHVREQLVQNTKHMFAF